MPGPIYLDDQGNPLPVYLDEATGEPLPSAAALPTATPTLSAVPAPPKSPSTATMAVESGLFAPLLPAWEDPESLKTTPNALGIPLNRGMTPTERVHAAYNIIRQFSDPVSIGSAALTGGAALGVKLAGQLPKATKLATAATRGARAVEAIGGLGMGVAGTEHAVTGETKTEKGLGALEALLGSLATYAGVRGLREAPAAIRAATHAAQALPSPPASVLQRIIADARAGKHLTPEELQLLEAEAQRLRTQIGNLSGGGAPPSGAAPGGAPPPPGPTSPPVPPAGAGAAAAPVAPTRLPEQAPLPLDLAGETPIPPVQPQAQPSRPDLLKGEGGFIGERSPDEWGHLIDRRLHLTEKAGDAPGTLTPTERAELDLLNQAADDAIEGRIRAANGEPRDIEGRPAFGFPEVPADQHVYTEPRPGGPATRFNNAIMGGISGAGAGLEEQDEDTPWWKTTGLALGGAALGAAIGTPLRARGFFSRLTAAANRLPTMRVKAEGAVNLLRKMGGFTEEELKWSTIPEWLAAKKGQTISTDELRDFVRQHEIEVEEVVLGGPEANDTYEIRDLFGEPIATFGNLDEARAFARDYSMTPGQDVSVHTVPHEPQWGPDNSPDLNLPGGQNYRELVFRLPTKEPSGQEWRMFRDYGEQYTRKRMLEVGYHPEWVDQMIQRFKAALGTRLAFRGAHHDAVAGPNILAHVRFDERTAPDGKKTLFIQEVQSDWHQQGAKRGYGVYGGSSAEERQALAIQHDALSSDIENAARSLASDLGLEDEAPPVILRNAMVFAAHDPAIQQRVDHLMQLFSQRLEVTGRLTAENVPDAPFKSSSLGGMDWETLALKRMVRWAAEHGFERIAWTTGEQQSARYNKLLKNIVGLDHNGNVTATGLPTITAYLADGSFRVLTPEQAKEARQLLGKERWDAFLATPAPKAFKAHSQPLLNLRDQPLTIASKGMTAAYDQRLPQKLMKLGKAFGGRVGKEETRTKVGYPEGIGWAFTPGETVWEVRNKKTGDLDTVKGEGSSPDLFLRRFPDYEVVREIPPITLTEPAWSFDLPPAMARSVMEQGQDLGMGGADLLVRSGGALVGGLYGGTQGDTPEERFGNALLGAGLGAAMGTAISRGGGTRPGVSPFLGLPARVIRRLGPNLPPSPAASLSGWLKTQMEKVIGPTFETEYGLKRAGLDKAVDAIANYRNDRRDVLSRTQEDIKTVLRGIETPEDYQRFWGIVALRDDVDMLAARPGTTLESHMTPQEATMSLQTLEAGASPEVLAAVDRHKALMQQIGQELVATGQMSPQTLAAHPNFLHAVVLKHYKEAQEIKKHIHWPIRIGRRGYLEPRMGGERETLHDYVKIMGSYLSDVYAESAKRKLIQKVMVDYDLLTSGQMHAVGGKLVGVKPSGYQSMEYGGQLLVVPGELADRLHAYLRTPPAIIKAMNRATAMSVGLILRSIHPAFTAGNFIGDMTRVMGRMPDNPVHTLTTMMEAAKAQSLLMRQEGRSVTGRRGSALAALSPRDRARLATAEIGRASNLGTGAATGSLTADLLQSDPELRRLSRNPNASTTARLKGRAGDLKVWTFHKQDLMREWGEGVPRLATFMLSLERGYIPEHAAKITRKVLFDYTSITPEEEHFFRGVLAPFYTFYKKNLVSYLPGIHTDAFGSKAGGAREIGRAVTRSLLASTIVTALWNETVTPDVEHSLSERERNQFHLNIPVGRNDDGSVNYWYIGLPTPANIAAKMGGLGGAVQRVMQTADALQRGHDVSSLLDEQLKISGQQIWESWTGLLNPLLTLPWEAVSGEAIRTGQQIAPKVPGLSPEGLSARFAHIAQNLPGVSPFARAAGEGEGLTETLGETTKRYLVGGLVRSGNVDDNRDMRLYEAIGRAASRYERDQDATKQEIIAPLTARFLEEGPQKAELTIRGLQSVALRARGAQGDLLQSLLKLAVADAAKKNRNFLPILKQLQVQGALPMFNGKRAPALIQELLGHPTR